jgi:hypothetical protein
MKFSEIKHLVDHQPFRPFAVRLSSGAQYSFNDPREFGAPRDFHIIFFFGETDAARIDTETLPRFSKNKVIAAAMAPAS